MFRKSLPFFIVMFLNISLYASDNTDRNRRNTAALCCLFSARVVSAISFSTLVASAVMDSYEKSSGNHIDDHNDILFKVLFLSSFANVNFNLLTYDKDYKVVPSKSKGLSNFYISTISGLLPVLSAIAGKECSKCA